MESRKNALKEVLVIAVGELVCTSIMLAIFALLGYFSVRVLFSGIAGAVIITVNYFFMAVVVELAADRAEKGQVEQAKKMISLSSLVRLLCLGIALYVGIKLGANIVALVLPLVFVRPILLVAEFFGKKGG